MDRSEWNSPLPSNTTPSAPTSISNPCPVFQSTSTSSPPRNVGHAHRFMKFILDAGAQVVIPAIEAPVADFKFAKDAVKLSLDQEIKVTQAINGIYDLALKENDHITSTFLQWFIKEQVEEVSSMNDLLKTVERAGEGGLLFVEQFLAQGDHGQSACDRDGGRRRTRRVNMSESAIVLKREITATRIPQGEALILPKGTPVIITQALGGSFTVVVPSEAGLYRIDSEHADALGRENLVTGQSGESGGPVDEAADLGSPKDLL